MTHIRRVVDARRTQGRLLYHLSCGHVATSTDVEPKVVGTEIACYIAECPSHLMPQVVDQPRFAEHWSRCFAAALHDGNRAAAIADADWALEEYRKRFP